ncbi:DinB family protein [Chromatium okenii]|uniref:Uncharacterized protein n=1 Tax=Chromatium okenii TaxID=61644 RepID=A0A2S7XR89_9GAMM|nr:DinB family protein [Chromatium okenii]PQJ96264.1 hypothetical protein CXB77_10870 [Chromatium okenii]
MNSRLPPPIALLPAHERQIADFGVRAYASVASPAAILRLFRTEAAHTLAMSRRLTRAQGLERVSIPRFPGIENESCHWSVYMTLDHLVMVNTAITALIHAICVDSDHDVEIELADVWPHEDAGADRIHALSAVVERYSRLIERLGPLRSRTRYPHPWFGALTARHWHALAAIHNRTHRIQIEKIVRRLNP